MVLPFATLSPAQAAYPGEPTVEVTVAPTEVTVDASGSNAVDTVFQVNVTGNNNFAVRPHTMWVNISFSSSSGWAVNPGIANLTLSLPAMGTASDSVSVTVTVPPGVSANEVTLFTASFREANDLRFSQGDAGNRTSQIHIAPIFATGAEFANGTAGVTVRQGQDGNISVRVTNNGNGNFTYEATLRNAGDLAPNDIVLKSTTPALVAATGSGIVKVVIHANPAAIPGPYTLQIRVAAAEAGASPSPAAYVDLIGSLTVQSAPLPPPPTGNNTTQPPPPTGNNTTNSQQTNPPPGSEPFYSTLLSFFTTLPSNPTNLALTLIGVIFVVLLLFVFRLTRKRKRARIAALERARAKRPLAQAAGPARPMQAPGATPLPRRVTRPMPRTSTPVRPESNAPAPKGAGSK